MEERGKKISMLDLDFGTCLLVLLVQRLAEMFGEFCSLSYTGRE